MPSRATACRITPAGCQRCTDDAAPAAETGLGSPILEALFRALEARDPGSHRHAQRVAGYASRLARECGLADAALPALHAAALLHDIGKLAVPDSLLHKPAALTESEFDCVKRHASIGADLLAAAPGGAPLAGIVRHHHENWDGTGYPDGLYGETIPLAARILAVADCFDALHSPRPYRDPLTSEVAVAMIRERRGTMFDPLLVDLFVRTMAPAAAEPVRTKGRLLCRQNASSR